MTNRSAELAATKLSVTITVNIVILIICDKTSLHYGLQYLINKFSNQRLYLFHFNGAWRRGERPGSKDRGPMFESCRGCDTADLFHFDAYNEGPPWGPRMSL